MKKRILALVITVASLFVLMAFFAGASACEYVAKSSTTVEITKFPITSNVVDIPDVNDKGKKIVSIKPGAFVYSTDDVTVDTLKIGANLSALYDGVLDENFSGLAKIELSDKNKNFKVVDNVLFSYDMKTLVKYAPAKSESAYTVPETVTAISASAFSNADDLRSVTLPSKLKTIGEYAFADCTGLSEVILPEALVSIGEYAFKGCNSLGEIKIPKNVVTIPGGAFSYCTSLVSAELAEGVKTIGEKAFFSSDALGSVVLPDSITSIGKDAFAATAVLSDKSNFEDGCLYIGKHLIKADKACSGRFMIKSGTLTMADDAFAGVNNITELLLPMSLRSVPVGAFSDITALEILVVAGYNTSFVKGSFIPGEGFERFHFCENSDVHKYFNTELIGIKREANYYKYISDDFRLTITKGIANNGTVSLGIADVEESKIPENIVKIFENGDITAFSISLTRGGKEIQPGTNVTYSLTLPAEYKDKINHVYFVSEKGELLWLNSTYNAENITFTSNKTGTFVIGRVVQPGDANNDAYINTKDVVLVAQYVAGWEIKNFDILSADGNCDGKITTKDVVLLAQYIANWAVVLGQVQPEGFPGEFVALDPYKSDFYLDDKDVLVVKSAITDGSGVYGEVKIASINGVSAENVPFEAFCNYIDEVYKDKATPEMYNDFFDVEKRETARTKSLYKKVFKATVIEYLRNAIGEEGYVPGLFAIDSVNEDGSLVLVSENAISNYNEELLENYKPSYGTVYTFIAADGIYTYQGKPRTGYKIEVSDSATVVCYGLQIVVCDLSVDVDEIAIGTYDYYTTYVDENLKTQKREHTDTWSLK